MTRAFTIKRRAEMAPLAIDLFCGLGGWTEGLLAEGYRVIGFDIERHCSSGVSYPAQLVIQDVLTLHGAQFKHATLIVASPPCQAYSYRAMPWKRAKTLPPPDNTLFEACFRIQREACEAAGHHIPIVVENVCGAQKSVGRANWHYGSFYLWGDVPALMPIVNRRRFKAPAIGTGKQFCAIRLDQIQDTKNNGGSWFNVAHNTTSGHGRNPDGRKGIPHRPKGHWTNPAEHHKNGGDWFGSGDNCSLQRRAGSKSNARKAASARIAKIPFSLSRHIARAWHPRES